MKKSDTEVSEIVIFLGGLLVTLGVCAILLYLEHATLAVACLAIGGGHFGSRFNHWSIDKWKNRRGEKGSLGE
jgi:hypothetical protein